MERRLTLTDAKEVMPVNEGTHDPTPRVNSGRKGGNWLAISS